MQSDSTLISLMTPLTGSHHPPCPTTTAHVEDDAEIGDGADVRKEVVEEVEKVVKCNNQIGSDAEKKFVRKLDGRIITLLVVLCSFPPFTHTSQ